MEANPNQETDGEQFVDMPGGDDVRPIRTRLTGDVNESPVGEPEPDYGRRAEEHHREGLLEHDNPNSSQAPHPDREELGMGANAASAASRLEQPAGDEEDLHPPYFREHLLQDGSGQFTGLQTLSQSPGFERRTVYGSGKGLERGQRNIDGALQPQLNGIDAPASSRRTRAEVEETERMFGSVDPSLETLVNQLLQQNAALQQELVEARLYSGSGSGSNASGERRTEGRGSHPSGMGSAATLRKGKGIGLGSEPPRREDSEPRVFRPQWTSFAAFDDRFGRHSHHTPADVPSQSQHIRGNTQALSHVPEGSPLARKHVGTLHDGFRAEPAGYQVSGTLHDGFRAASTGYQVSGTLHDGFRAASTGYQASDTLHDGFRAAPAGYQTSGTQRDGFRAEPAGYQAPGVLRDGFRAERGGYQTSGTQRDGVRAEPTGQQASGALNDGFRTEPAGNQASGTQRHGFRAEAAGYQASGTQRDGFRAEPTGQPASGTLHDGFRAMSSVHQAPGPTCGEGQLASVPYTHQMPSGWSDVIRIGSVHPSGTDIMPASIQDGDSCPCRVNNDPKQAMIPPRSVDSRAKQRIEQKESAGIDPPWGKPCPVLGSSELAFDANGPAGQQNPTTDRASCLALAPLAKGRLTAQHRPQGQIPPLPKYSGPKAEVSRITVICDGVEREGILHEQGRLCVGGPEYFSGASDDENSPAPTFGVGADPGGVFQPGARSPFQAVLPSAPKTADAEPIPVAISAPPPPPQPSTKSPRPPFRKRSPSPRTPYAERLQ